MSLLIKRTFTSILLAIALALQTNDTTIGEIVKFVLLFSAGMWTWELIHMLRFNKESQNMKAINIGDPKELEESDLPPELKKVLGNFAKSAKKVEKQLNETTNKKCKDPHCKDCWGEIYQGNAEHKNEEEN